MAGQRETEDGDGAPHLDKHREAHDIPASKPVCGHTGDHHQDQGGQELDQSDPAEQCRILGQIVDLPAHRHRNDLGT